MDKVVTLWEELLLLYFTTSMIIFDVLNVMELVNHKGEITFSEFRNLESKLLQVEINIKDHKKTYEQLLNIYESIKKDLDYYSFFYNPTVIISEVNNKNLGHKWVGRVRIPSEMLVNTKAEGQKSYLQFTICEGKKYSKKTDEGLQIEAVEAAKEKIRVKFSKKE